ncbi:MAG: 30S ribosomal protein S20 [Clostridia bacterium]
MPNIKSAVKRVKVNEKKNLRNRMIKSAMRTTVKKYDVAVATGAADAQLLSATASAIDKAASKGVIHKNAANRKKARMAKRLNKAAAAE